MVARIALTFSLWLSLCGLALAQTDANVAERLREHPDRVESILREHPDLAKDPDIAPPLQSLKKKPENREEVADQIATTLEMRDQFGSVPRNAEAAGTIQAVKNSPLYRDPGVDQNSNWLSRALARLGSLIPKFNPNTPNIGAPSLVFGAWVTYLLWGLLGLVLIGLTVYVLRYVTWQRGLARRAKAMLEEDEPERTLDEWLAQADALAAEGRHREAVRALFLACLLRFDEHRVARFVRGETNWEHLKRIENSPTRPAEIDFRPATQAFDRVWYGFQVRGAEDVARFRAWYSEITETLARRAA